MDRFPVNAGKFTDGGITINSKKRVLSAQFGDGYEQTAVDGINPDISTFNITWTDIKVDDANVICSFLEPRLTIKPFLISIPGGGGEMAVKCTTLSRTYSNDYVNTISAEFKRDYTPGG